MTGRLAHQFGADRDVAPLVRSAELQGAVVVEVQAQEVVGLQEHVGELGEGEPTSSRSSRLLTMSLAIIWFTVKCLPTSRKKSVRDTVVSQSALFNSSARTAPRLGEVQEAPQLLADARQVALDLFDREQRPLDRLETGVADESGTSPRQGNGPVAGDLETSQRAELHEMTQVQGGGGRVETDVGRDATDVRRSRTASSVVWWTRPRNCQSSRSFIGPVYGAVALEKCPRRREVHLQPDDERVPRARHLEHADDDEQRATDSTDGALVAAQPR